MTASPTPAGTTVKNLNLVDEIERALQFGAMTGRHHMRESRPVNSAKPGHDQCDGRRRNEIARGEQRDRFRAPERRQQNGARKRGCGEVEGEIAKVGDAGELPDARWRRDRVQQLQAAGGSVRMCLMTATLAAIAMTIADTPRAPMTPGICAPMKTTRATRQRSSTP